ncbi:putative DCC family thiol-disulfide oxidoreductase YuxK [Actimicrobium sp. GrIS 1.19]|uniref:thiol-disulfide oxidoreductase DCC family protein n=1 Tax=Actimicrobium sp. GrIS 1.19 TaxID=3071708 RepID=UPI002E037EF2|nr:putative DCC family thiol-disulfide oxidoreductase YuxK [Actimicrobium sp. GrIS 1.19]
MTTEKNTQDTTSSTDRTPAPAALQVMFDGSCPLCRREVGVYRDLTPSAPIQWVDVSDPNNLLPSGAERAVFMARFHVRTADGRLLGGAAAFVALWLTLPGWRWLGRFGALPGVTPLLEVVYRGFLRVRPLMQRLARRLERTA